MLSWQKTPHKGFLTSEVRYWGLSLARGTISTHAVGKWWRSTDMFIEKFLRTLSYHIIFISSLYHIIISYHHHIIITISSFNVFYLTVNWTWSLICSCLSLSSQPNVWKDFGWWPPPADLFLSRSEKCSAGGGGFKHFLPYSGQWFIFLITYSSRV